LAPDGRKYNVYSRRYLAADADLTRFLSFLVYSPRDIPRDSMSDRLTENTLRREHAGSAGKKAPVAGSTMLVGIVNVGNKKAFASRRSAVTAAPGRLRISFNQIGSQLIGEERDKIGFHFVCEEIAGNSQHL
jgi:hypothetical protein